MIPSRKGQNYATAIYDLRNPQLIGKSSKQMERMPLYFEA